MKRSDFLVGIVLAILGLGGLIIAGNATDRAMSLFGGALFAFGVLMNFWFIKRHFDFEEKHPN